MDYLKVSSIVTDFWDLLFYPLLIFALCLFELKTIIGKDSFRDIISTIYKTAQQYSQKIKQYDQLNKVAPIIIVFILFSFLHFFSICISCLERFFYVGFSFKHDSLLTEEVVLDVWKYHPEIKDVYTLQRIVYYKAKQNDLGTFKLLSSDGIAHLPDSLIRALYVFSVFLVIVFSCSLLFGALRPIFSKNHKEMMGNPGKKIKRVVYSIFAQILIMIIICLMSFINRYSADDYSLRAWTQYELELISSGAPPESDIDIETEHQEEVSEWIDNIYDQTRFYMHIGTTSLSLTYSDGKIFFHKDRTNLSY